METDDFTKHEVTCGCGAPLMFHCRAQAGASVGEKFGSCPRCGAAHQVPDTVLARFEKVGGKWVQFTRA
jgi:hypothetical protein